MRFHLFISSIVFISSAMASACPDILKNVKTSYLPKGSPTLCELANEYEALKRKMADPKKPGSHPDRFADVLAPRMINPPRWESKRKSVQFDPWFIYEPAPKTWGGWERGRAFIEEHTADLIETKQVPELSVALIKKIDRISMRGLDTQAGRIRKDYDDVGDATEEEYALTEKQANAIESVEYVMQDGKPVIAWNYTRCQSKLSAKEKKAYDEADGFPYDLFANDTKEMAAFKKDGGLYYCGYITYVPYQQVNREINKYIESINSGFKTLITDSKNEDPLLLASRAQRWFVSIHPFGDGNGRQSRFMMEFVLRSLGLPSPILKNMDFDLYSTEAQWAQAIGDGIVKALHIMKKCSADTGLEGCNLVPLKAPTKPTVEAQ